MIISSCIMSFQIWICTLHIKWDSSLLEENLGFPALQMNLKAQFWPISNKDGPRSIAEITLDSGSFKHLKQWVALFILPIVLKHAIRIPFPLFLLVLLAWQWQRIWLIISEDFINYNMGTDLQKTTFSINLIVIWLVSLFLNWPSIGLHKADILNRVFVSLEKQ